MKSMSIWITAILILAATATCSMAQMEAQIMRAIQQEDSEKIRSVIERDKNVLRKRLPQVGLSPLHFAIQSGKPDSVETLLKLNAPLDSNNSQKRTALHAALAYKNAEIVDLILSKTGDVNAVDRNQSTPLNYAVMYRHNGPEILAQLLKRGAKIDVKNKSQQTPLHVACYYDRADCGKLLIEAGADLQVVDNNANTPLLAACLNSPDLVKQMLDKGADPLVRNRQGQTALHLACQANRFDIVDLVVDRFENVDLVDKQYRTPLLMAVYAGNVETVQFLLQRGADPNRFNSANGQTKIQPPVCFSAARGNAKMIELLAQAGAEVNVEDPIGDRPLHLAAQAAGNIFGQQADRRNAGQPFVDSIRVLIQYRADPNLKNRAGRTALQVAAQRDFFDAVELLVQKTDDLDFDLGTATLLHWAAGNGLMTTAKRLISTAGLEIDATDESGRTPILVAADNGQAALVELLIRNNANLDRMDDAGSSAVLLAAERGHAEVVRALIKAGANVEQLDASGQSALHLAAWNGADEVVSELLSFSDLLDLKTQTGYTALHAAAWNGHAQVIRKLLEAGADPNASDSDGWTPLHKAAYRGHAQAVEELLLRGANKNIVTGAGLTARSMAEGNQKMDVMKLLN